MALKMCDSKAWGPAFVGAHASRQTVTDVSGLYQIFYNLLGEAGLPLFLDFFQQHFGSGYHLLFPVSWASYEYGLFGLEASLLAPASSTHHRGILNDPS
jgi:hypothetical protein